MTDRDTDFANWLGEDVKPLPTHDKVRHPQQRAPLDPLQARLRRQAAEQETEQADPFRDSEYVEMLNPDDVLSFRRPGVQHGVFRKLRLGQYQSDARLDLHRTKLNEARRNVYQFIKDCLANQIRCCQIIHGMGRHSQPPALLKSHVNAWLQQMPEVMAFYTSTQQDGGFGAVYVLLRKSAKAKQHNREQFQRRR